MASSTVDASSNQETTHGSPMSAQGTQKRAREPSESGGAGSQPLTLLGPARTSFAGEPAADHELSATRPRGAGSQSGERGKGA